MPDIGTLQTVHQGSVRILGVTQGTLRPTKVQTAIINWQGEAYDGDYVIIPSTEQQVMATKHKTMQDDVTIREIPYFETSNISGVTAYIASTLDM